MTLPNQTNWMLEDEAAAYARISRETLARARRKGKISPPMLNGKSYGYTVQMMDEYIQSCRNKSVYKKD
jgi:predicted site-specific integrase-resolvase